MSQNLQVIKEQHSQIIDDVIRERINQDNKFGAHRHHHPAEWLMILGEEVGEVNEEGINFTFQHFEYKKIQALKDMRKELVQVAAVAMAFIQDIDNHYKPNLKSDAERGR
ncbi:MAG: hypothetical protein VYB38_14260 [Bacteroidota bacterium]|nr:hypothetical protein [Bacteroidota bacterium]MEE3148759.1 hypothetical protein [Bacteroidota bacterium]MEE3244894.1 hypothetical protein [Bacteroidota bacterium]